MRTLAGMVVVGVCVTACLSLAGPVAASCWSCDLQVVGGQDAWVCVSAGLGEAGYTDCTPQWASEFPNCKFSGSPCSGNGEWRPPRYPVLIYRDRPVRLTTQVVFLSVVGAGPEPRTSYLTPSGSSGLEPMALARRIAPKSDVLPKVLAYSVESASGMTLARYRGNDGSGLTVSVQPLSGGFVVVLRDAGNTGSGPTHAPIFVLAGQAAVFSARIQGRDCSVVVHPLVTDGEGRPAERRVAELHRSFLDAVERYPSRDLIGLRTDWPSGETTLASPALVSALTARMLVTNLLVARY